MSKRGSGVTRSNGTSSRTSLTAYVPSDLGRVGSKGLAVLEAGLDALMAGGLDETERTAAFRQVDAGARTVKLPLTFMQALNNRERIELMRERWRSLSVK